MRLLEGGRIPREQFFPPLEVTSGDRCLEDRPPLFAIGYEFPGLELPLDATMRFYRGS